MRHRRLATLLAAVTVAGLAAAGCGSTSAAVQVDDESISQPDFEDDLEVVYENETFRTALFGQVGQEQLRGEDAPLGAPTNVVLVFGRETGGLPNELHDRYRDRFVTMPILSAHVRSLNLSTSVAIALYEVLRQRRAVEP